MTARALTREEALAYQQRWRLVRKRTLEAERTASLEQRFEALEVLMQSLDDFGWREKLDDDAAVRARWALLRQRLARA